MIAMSKINLRKFLLLFACLLANLAIAQTYVLRNVFCANNFDIQPTEDGVSCLFENKSKKAPNTSFRKIFLNTELKKVDSINYTIEGRANLLASIADEKYVTNAFYSKANGIEKIFFVVTDQSGEVQYTFSKQAADFAPCFDRSLKKLKHFGLSFVSNTGSPGMLLVQPYTLQGSTSVPGRILAMNATDGKHLWMLPEKNLSKIQTTGKLLIALTSNSADIYYSIPDYQIAFFDKESGKLISKVPFRVQGKGYRSVPVFTTNGIELMLAGSEFPSMNDKNGKFYMSLYNLEGERIVDHIDSAAVLSSKRLHLMGSAFDDQGNLVLIGEGWKPDATRMVASTAATFALAVLTRGAYVSGIQGVDHKIENLVFATLSSTNGKLQSLKTYPVGPWLTYGGLMTESNHVVIQYFDHTIIYDVNTPEMAPAPLTMLNTGERMILLPTGPVIVKPSKSQFILRRLH
jgi:hypothetical protein